ncbi:MAG: MetQ/NlpA family ABC transporter substrate-binding protein [Thermodesulfobacteriota bacterium]
MSLKNSFRRKWLGALAWLLVLAAAGPAGGQEALTVGVLPVVDTLPLWVAQENGLFEKQGLSVQLVSFQSALERDAALQAGRLDGCFGDIMATVLLISAGQDLGIVTTAFHTTPASRMFGLAVAPGSGLTGLEGLKGSPVAISRATIIEYLLDRLLAAQGLGPDYVAKQEIKKIPLRLQMLLADQIPAALLPEPLLTLAETKGAKVLLDDRVLDVSLTVIALRRSLGQGGDGPAARFREAYGQAVEQINRAPESFKPLMVARTNFPEPVRDQYRMPVFPPVGLPSGDDIADVLSWLRENKMIEKGPPYERIVFPPSP